MFEHKDVWLRPIERADLDFLRKMHNDWTTLENLTDTNMVNEIQQEGWFESICRSKSAMRLAAGIKNYGIVGCVRLDYIDLVNRSVQVGGDIAKEYRGAGRGSAMFSACLKYSFDVLNVRRTYLSVLETNTRAIDMYNKHGFKEEGRQTKAIFRLGRYYDYINMYLLEPHYRSQQ